MTTIALQPAGHARGWPAFVLGSRWLWCWLALVLVVLRAWGSGDLAGMAKGYGDTDDATRLVQVRAFMAGAGWYDLLLERFGGATPLVSHWSRLVDAPLAMLLRGLEMVMPPEQAEYVLRLIWPLGLLLVLFRVLTAAAEHAGGRAAGVLALVLAATMLTGLFRFMPGRIDHHNVMILATVAGLLSMLQAINRPGVGYGAGALLGFALTIGFEPIALIGPVMAAAGLAGAINRRLLASARNVAVGLTLALAAGLAVSLPPSVWQLPVCDAIGLNLVAAAALGTGGLMAADRISRAQRALMRCSLVAVAGCLAVVAYLVLSPQCIDGPFASVSVAAKQLWLDTVLETFAIGAVWRLAPDSATLIVATIVLAIGATLVRLRHQRDPARWALLVLLLIAAAPTLLAYKLYPYFSFLAAYALALAIAELNGTDSMPARTQRIAAVFAVNQATLVALLVPVVTLAAATLAPTAARPASATERQAVLSNGDCYDMATMRTLAVLPKGLIVAHPDLGPFVVASTHHDVLAAPYHRIDRAIVQSHEVFAKRADLAIDDLQRLGADYVMMCGSGQLPRGLSSGPDSLIEQLRQQLPQPHLKAVTLTPATGLRVWRVVR